MTEPIWYYARGQVEKGPISTAQIKALVAAGKLRPDDYVWKEGMENWSPAGDIPDLFPAERPATSGAEAEPKPASDAAKNRVAARPAVRPRPPIEPMKIVRPLGQAMLMIGLLVVLLARGCDALGDRYAARKKAIADAAESRFKEDWDGRRMELEDEQQVIRDRSRPTPADQKKLQELSDALNRLDAEKQQEQQTLHRGRWRDQRIAAEHADADNRMWAYWREAAFLLGTMVLATGLLAVCYTSDGPERWICLAMLAVILYSLYGRGAWGDVFGFQQ